jgi:hypothetical protein
LKETCEDNNLFSLGKEGVAGALEFKRKEKENATAVARAKASLRSFISSSE